MIDSLIDFLLETLALTVVVIVGIVWLGIGQSKIESPLSLFSPP